MRKPFAVLFIVLQIVLYAGAWRTVSPKESDFPAFYSAARLWHEGANPYDLEQQCGKQFPIRGEPCLPFAHPPVLLPLLSLISSDDFVGSYYRWTIVLLTVVLICLIPFYKISKQWQLSVQSILFLPIVIALALGQDTPFILLSVLCWLWLLGERRDFLAGLALSLSVLKPQIAILLGVPLLFARPKAFLGFVLGGLTLLLFSFVLVGRDGFSGLLYIVRLMSHGEGFGVNPAAMVSVTGLLARLGLGVSWSWIFFGLALIAISILWRKLGTTPPVLSAGIALALFCTPHMHLHDLSLSSGPTLFIHPLAPAAVSAFLAVAYAFRLQQFATYVLLGFVIVFMLRNKNLTT
jgi:hypothetical protein